MRKFKRGNKAKAFNVPAGTWKAKRQGADAPRRLALLNDLVRIAARRGVFYRGSTPSGSILGGHIFCGHCGCLLRRKVIRETAYWICNRRDENKDGCPVPQIPEPALAAALLRLHNKLMLHGSELLQPMLDQLLELREQELCSNQKLSDIDREIAKLSAQNLVLIRLKSKGCADPALILSQTEEMGRRLRELRRERRKVLDAAGGNEQIQTTESMLDYLSGAQWQAEVTPELFETLVEQLTVVSAQNVKLRLLNGL